MDESQRVRSGVGEGARFALFGAARRFAASGAALLGLGLCLLPGLSEAPTVGGAQRELTAAAPPSAVRGAQSERSAPRLRGFAASAEPVQISAEERERYAVLLALLVLSR